MNFKNPFEQHKGEFEPISKAEYGRDWVIELLRKHNIAYEEWGKGSTKTLEHLITEITNGESQLVETEAHELVRRLTVNLIDVGYKTPNGQEYILQELKQVFKDGRKRVRILGASIAEKLEDNEPADSNSVARAIKEELGIEGAVQIEKLQNATENSKLSSYPGLTSETVFHEWRVWLNGKQYNPDGYIEHQKDKDVYFVWEEVTDRPRTLPRMSELD